MKLCSSKLKNFFIFRETELSSPKTKKTSEGNFPSSKSNNNNEKKQNTLKEFLIFREIEISCRKLKRILHFKRELAKPENEKFLIFL